MTKKIGADKKLPHLGKRMSSSLKNWIQHFPNLAYIFLAFSMILICIALSSIARFLSIICPAFKYNLANQKIIRVAAAPSLVRLWIQDKYVAYTPIHVNHPKMTSVGILNWLILLKSIVTSSLL
jgi:hypothetical protein